MGNGERTCFWKDRWLFGQAPMDIAPLCYRLAWRKNKTVAQSMQQNTWMRVLQRISTSEELYQFVDLWKKLQSIHLTPHPDLITWRFTANGEYSCRSAYQVQFLGSHPDYHWNKIWRLKVENKCKFFLWLFLQHKLLTADRIIKRGGQANPLCQLCRTRNENASHLAANCSYSKSVWTHISQVRAAIPPSTNH